MIEFIVTLNTRNTIDRMSDYRRYFVAGATYFFTVVTDRRAALFADSAARRLLGSVLRRSAMHSPVRVVAIVLLPDHLHCLWNLPPGDCDYSSRWRWLKGEFTSRWLELGGIEQPRGSSRVSERRRASGSVVSGSTRSAMKPIWNAMPITSTTIPFATSSSQARAIGPGPAFIAGCDKATIQSIGVAQANRSR